jgi:exonuclease SbcD
MAHLKIISTADLHLGYAGPLQQAPPDVQQNRIEDGLCSFEKIAEHALRERADFLVVCGDVFHTLRPSGYVFNRFAEIVGRLSTSGIQTLVVAGNHDTPRVAGAEPYLSALEAVKAPGFHFFKDPCTRVLRGENSEREVRFVVLPYAHLVSPEEDKRAEWIESTLRELLSKGGGEYTVAVSHLVAAGSYLGILKELVPYPEPPISKEVLLPDGIDLVLLGHLHEYQSLYEKVVYPGSPERMSFSEEKSRKGFVEVFERDGHLRHRFIEARARPLLTYPSRDHISLAESEQPTDELLRVLKEVDIPEGAIMRVRFKLGPKQHLNWPRIVESLREKGILYPVPERVRERPGVLEIRGLLPSTEALLKEFVDTTLRGSIPPRVAKLVKREGCKIIREVSEAA